MAIASVKMKTNDNRKVFPQVYELKPGPAQILQLPALQYVAQEMSTSFHMNWAGRPEPLDEPYIVWKVVNQLKRISKSLNYKFKLMPPELIWRHTDANKRSSVTHLMQVPDCITQEMFDVAKAHVSKQLRGRPNPETRFIGAGSALCAQKLHVGHYRDTQTTVQEITAFVEEQGYRVKGNRTEIYLTPPMQCHPPETWRTIVRVEIEQLG
ncbi:GyrI-like domain-containing protein [Paenibacillus sp. NPDC056579]|uniref:GyrI-like domain-containing protein n=1 Tax=unclassified Paenibacillus TaxID=185978 RepID=UPI001EF90284|nr:GyrI-like domain-containing protein [Paenibacillus sp. H1-7]ULL18018.1 hypothetical protein DVH26_28265 [Paenibacillus sp. H1-7]